MKVGLILLAAGQGRRFGGGKLEYVMNGRSVIDYILSNIPLESFAGCVLVAGNETIRDAADRYHIPSVLNDQPEQGIARSIRMGTVELPPMDAYMYCVCDQPLLQSDTLVQMVKTYPDESIYVLCSPERRGNPVIFPADLENELIDLQHDESGRTVILRHVDRVQHYMIDDESQLMDMDTVDDLHRIMKFMASTDGAVDPKSSNDCPG